MEDVFDGVGFAADGTPLLSAAQQERFVALIRKSSVLLGDSKFRCMGCGADLEVVGRDDGGRPELAPHDCPSPATASDLRFGSE